MPLVDKMYYRPQISGWPGILMPVQSVRGHRMGEGHPDSLPAESGHCGIHESQSQEKIRAGTVHMEINQHIDDI